MFRGVINRWREQTLGLPPLPLTGYFDRLGTRQIPIINGFSQHVVQRPADWRENIHITGYWLSEVERWVPPADLLAFLEAGNPPIFIGFGSMPLKDPERTTNMILKALSQSGQRGILHTGWGGLGNQALPGHVFKIDWAPYGWLFPRMSMVIHHGGSGTTAFALRSGVPSCVVSFVFDQFYWGERIAEVGVGPAPIRYSGLTVARLKEVIQLGVTSSQIRRSAEIFGGKIRAENGIENTLHVIDQILRTHS
jgi:UDP:flavonoid glycosyltransferase YjiC (YdhE family)